MKQRTINQRLLAHCLTLFFLSSAIAVYVNIGTGKTLEIYNNFTTGPGPTERWDF